MYWLRVPGTREAFNAAFCKLEVNGKMAHSHRGFLLSLYPAAGVRPVGPLIFFLCMEQLLEQSWPRRSFVSTIGYVLKQQYTNGTFIVFDRENYGQWIQLKTEREYSWQEICFLSSGGLHRRGELLTDVSAQTIFPLASCIFPNITLKAYQIREKCL